MKNLIIMMALASIFASCNASNSDKVEQTPNKEVLSIPKTVVYRTSADYSNYVPVIMNKEKTAIVSYPSKADLGCNGSFSKPTPLKNGYLLDNRGINENVAFLSYTYEEYCALETEPNVAEMLMNIKDKNPLTELILCPPRNEFNDIVADINKLIDNGFTNCERINL